MEFVRGPDIVTYGGSALSTRTGVPVTRRIYPKPPIVEAIAEFEFRGVTLDEPGRSAVTAQLATSYDGRRWRQKELVILATATPSSVGSSATQVDGPEFLINADGTRVIGVGQKGLSVHVLAPYPGWEAFLEAIQEAVALLPQSFVDAGFARVTLRYIDRWRLAGGVETLPDYVTIAPAVRSLGVVPRRLHLFHEFAGEREGETAMLFVAAEPVDDGATTVVLDLGLTAFRTGDESPEVETWSETLARLHDRQREIFEASITDASRRLFE